VEAGLTVMPSDPKLRIYFSEYFGLDASLLEGYGAFNVSLINDLPLFIDPFLLFNSAKPAYRHLHAEIIRYLRFLRDKAAAATINDGLLQAWFTFPEVRQTWLGFSQKGNGGRGLGCDFARSLFRNLGKIFAGFGTEPITKDSHLEKLCLIEEGVGRDNISDFTTNLIKGFLATYTQAFAVQNVQPANRRRVSIPKASFNYDTETWQSATFELPFIGGDHVILTPRDLLTRDETWINRDDLLGNLEEILCAVPDFQLRDQVNNYLSSRLARRRDAREPTATEKREAAAAAILSFPAVLDHYIRLKEDDGDKARILSDERVLQTERAFIQNVRHFVSLLSGTAFYGTGYDTLEEARQRVLFLKDVIEHQGGHHLFYGADHKPIRRESDLQIFYRLTWFATASDVNREVNNGRGPVDFKISRGNADKSLVELKLARNSKLEANLANQVRIYEQANNTHKSLKVIIYFTSAELDRVHVILKRLRLSDHPDVVLIDARSDNKPSASVAV
jgi:hypothetical protein